MACSTKVVEENDRKLNIKSWIKVCLIVLLISGMFFLGKYNFLLYHLLIELFSIFIGTMLLLISIKRIEFKLEKNSWITFLGISYGFISLLDFLHTISYEGMGILPNNTANLASQFWIIARYVESISILMLCYYIYTNKKVTAYRVTLRYMFATAILLSSLFLFNVFPEIFNKGAGIKSFKIISEYVICIVLLISIHILNRQENKLDYKTYKSLIKALAFKTVASICFALCTDAYGIFNIIGHLFKGISIYIFYESIVLIKLIEPYKLLENERETLKAIINSASSGIIVLSNKLEVIHINTKFKEIWDCIDYPTAIKEKNSIQIIKYIKKQLKNPDNFNDTINDSGAISENKKDILYTLDGRTIELDMYEYNISGVKGGRVLRFEDITSKLEMERLKKESEEEKIKLEEELRYNELRSQLFANISHELKTPLNIILGSIQLIENVNYKEDKTKYINKVNNYTSMMKKNCYRLLRILNNVIDITRYDAGFITVNLESYNIINIIEDITLSIVPYAEEKEIDIIFDTEVEENVVKCDPDKIERIMLNLLSNAIKFTPKGGKIFVNIYQNNNNISIIVKDTGIGIPNEKMDKIFKRFGQVSSKLSKVSGGSGIGLSLVKILVEEHGGQISVRSKEKEGTEFEIILPTDMFIEDNSVSSVNEYTNDELVERLSIELSDIYDTI